MSVGRDRHRNVTAGAGPPGRLSWCIEGAARSTPPDGPPRGAVEAHVAADNVDSALREYEDFRRFLFDELGREPSAEMQALVEGLKLN